MLLADLTFRIFQPQRRKVLKNQKVIKVKDAHTHNNGDIEIVPMEGRFKGVKHSPEEIISQGLRYQVPEQVVILDFWTKVKRDRYGHLLDSNESARGETPQTSETFDFSDSSSLTSMEASPEPPRPMPLPQAAVGNSNGQTDGAQLLWLFAKQQSEREGTEVRESDYLARCKSIFADSTRHCRSRTVIHQILEPGRRKQRRKGSKTILRCRRTQRPLKLQRLISQQRKALRTSRHQLLQATPPFR